MLAYVISGTVKDAAAFRELATDLSARVEADEPGTEAYQWFLSEDEGSAMLYEQYADSDALLAHFGNVRDAMGRFVASLDVTGVFAFGDLDDAARAALDGLGAVYAGQVAGFMR